MAATFHDGFSATVPDIEIGHRLGLRWFRLDNVRHGIEKVTQSISSPSGFVCRCGAQFTAWDREETKRWLAVHRAAIDTPVLSGVSAPWLPGVNVAACHYHSDHHPPEPHCGCGFWAYWALGEQQVCGFAVPAIVKGWGGYIEGTLGFRCSHAKILAVYLPGQSPQAANGLENHYQVDVYDNFQAMLEMYKDQTPPEQPPLTDAYYRYPDTDKGMSFGFNAATAAANTANWSAGAKATFAALGGGGGNTTFAAGGLVVSTLVTQRLRAARQKAWQMLKDMTDAAASRAFTGAEQAKWDKLNGIMDRLDTKIAKSLRTGGAGRGNTGP